MTFNTSWPGGATDSTARSESQERTFFGHPRSLATVFSIETWERFSFYGMQAILTLYLIATLSDHGMGYSHGLATAIVGAYAALPYLTSAVWGWVADRILGTEKVLLISAIVVMLGHISLGVFAGALGLIVGLPLVGIGSGGVKSATQSMVHSVYDHELESRRDAGFALYYMGINLGAFLGPILVGVFKEKWGWHVGFSLAAFLMFIGLMQYCLGRKKLPLAMRQCSARIANKKIIIGLIIIALVLISFLALFLLRIIPIARIADCESIFIVVIVLACFGYLGFSSKVKVPGERRMVLVYIPVFVVSVLFWALYQQQFTILQIMFQDRTNLSMNLFGWHFSFLPAWFNSINSILIICFAPIIGLIWNKLGRRNPSAFIKTGCGVVLIGIVYVLFSLLPHRIPLIQFVLIIALLTVAELVVSPVGMSLAGDLAPKVFPVQMMTLNLLNVSLGTSLTGVVGQYYNPSHPVPYFLTCGLIAIIAGIVFLIFVPKMLAVITAARKSSAVVTAS